MPPDRYNPSQRVHGRGKFPDATLQYAETSSSAPSADAPPNTSQNQNFSLFCNGWPATPAAHFLLANGVDPALVHDFSPVLVHDPTHIFDLASGLPLPSKPDPSLAQSSTSSLLERAASPLSTPSASSSSPPSTTQSVTPRSPRSKPPAFPTATLATTTNVSPAVRISQPSTQPARPPNHFLLFRADYHARVKSLHLSKARYAALPKDYDQWDRASDTVKMYYRELARLTKEVHGRLHPGYKYKPRSKDERQRQKDEKAKIRQETKTAARATRNTKSQAKSSTPTAAKTTSVRPSPPPPASVDVRMYDPSRRTYHRLRPSQASSVSPSSLPLPSPSSLPSTPSPAPSGVRNTTNYQDTDIHAPNSSLHMTSPAYTLFQADETESLRFEESHSCTDDDDDMLEDLWPTIEEGVVDWYQAAPPHWCKPNDHAPFCDDDDNACDNCVALSWSDELNIDIPTASTTTLTEYNITAPSLSFAPLAPTLPLYTHCRPTFALPTVRFASDAMDTLLASTERSIGEMDAFWHSLFVVPVHNSSTTLHTHPILTKGYTSHA